MNNVELLSILSHIFKKTLLQPKYLSLLSKKSAPLILPLEWPTTLLERLPYLRIDFNEASESCTMGEPHTAVHIRSLLVLTSNIQYYGDNNFLKNSKKNTTIFWKNSLNIPYKINVFFLYYIFVVFLILLRVLKLRICV